MAALPPIQPPNDPQEQAQRRRRIGITAIILFSGILVVLALNYSGILHDPWSKIVTAILGGFGIVFNYTPVQEALKSIFSLVINAFSRPSAVSSTSTTSNQIQAPQSIDKLMRKSCTRIKLPPIGSRGILARVDLVKRVYAELQKPSTNAIVLTGLIGSGKSILAELIYHFAEEQRRTYKTFFTAEALWIEFKFTSRSNLSDMAELIFKAVGKRIPDFKNLDVDKQVAELYKALEKRFMLIVLDQFDILLDWQTGSILEECQGMSEWLREINSRQCKCKMLITGCSMWSGIEGLPKGYIHQHDVSELESNEAIKLLQDQNIQGTKEEMDAAVKIFNNHPKALRLLGEYLNREQINLSTFLEDPVSCQFWVKNIASSLFDEKYRMHLDNNPEISKFLLGFAVFREPVQQITAVAVADTQAKIQDKTVRTVIETVRRQYLLQPVGEGLYKLHPIIAAYIRDYFARNDLQALKNAHTKAEQFYMSQQRVRYAKKEKRQHTIIEAIWQQCQAEDYQGAFKLILEEQIFDNLHEWKELKSLLELLLLIDKNSLEAQQSIYIYLNQGRVYYTLGNEKQAKEYYEIVWNLSRELSDLTLRAYLLDCIGIYYYDRALYKEALAFFLLAKDLFEGMQSQNPHYTIVQEHITMLSKKTDEAQFKVLMKDLEQSKHQIAEEAINEDTG